MNGTNLVTDCLILMPKQLRKIVIVAAAAALLWGYCIVYVDPAIGVVGMSFQIFAFAAGLVILLQKKPSGRLTLGNLGVIYALGCISYLLFPSVLCLTNSSIHIQYGDYVTPEIGNLLFWLHGLYFLAFVVAYVVSSGPVSNLKIIGRNQLPSGIRLSILAFLAFLIVFFVQALSTGRWLPQLDREVAVLEAYEAGVASIQVGGLSLLCYQILNRVSGFALLFLGLGFGLICAKYTSRRVYSLLLMIGMLVLSGLLVIFTGGGRGAGLIVMLVALVFADYLSGPLQWRYLLVLFAIGIVGTEFVAYARFLTADIPFSPTDWFSYWTSTGDKFFEQTVMLGKEAVVVSHVDSTGETWGPVYFIQTVLRIIPQQIILFKQQFVTVDRWLGDVLLGANVERGAGLAGTAIGEGYFVGGAPGVVVIGGISGLILGLAERKLLRRGDRRIWHLIPLAYLAGNLPFLLRSDLYELLNTLILGVLPLSVVLWLLFKRMSPDNLWNQPLYDRREKRFQSTTNPPRWP
jgi:hypothetical protein